MWKNNVYTNKKKPTRKNKIMATIFPRKNKNGSVSWRVMIRRKGLKPFISSFTTEEDAKKFVQECEEGYCLDTENFSYDYLVERRKREFTRKKTNDEDRKKIRC